MKIVVKRILFLFLIMVPGIIQAAVELEKYTKTEFSPTHGQRFKIPVKLDKEATLAIEIWTSDGNLLTTIRSKKVVKPGRRTLVWDGKDSNDQIVPDEAYIPVIKATYKDGASETIDPREKSGGEIVDHLKVQITATKDIAYILPAPSRVMIRVGVKGGPMLRSLATWVPHGPGKNIQRWDGYDSNQLFDLRKEKDLSVLVTAFKLPEHAILTVGNKKLSYREYHQKMGWRNPVIVPEGKILSKGNARISRHYYTPRSMDSDPRVEMTFKGEVSHTPMGIPIIRKGDNIAVQVDIPKEDRWLMNESLYEVAFFINNEFAAEEEQGYVPITWVWKPSNLKPGKHIITTNISGFSGKVGVTSILFEIKD